MTDNLVSVVKYEKPLESVRKAIDLANGLDNLPENAKVFIKPNVVYWNKDIPFPKWGMITTSRVMEDVVKILSEHDVDEILIGEGVITMDPTDTETAQDAFEKLGYNLLKERYGAEPVNLFERPFEKVDLGNGVSARMNKDILNSDYVIDLPVLKTHAQTMVSLSIKNLKGTIHMSSRKKFHSEEEEDPSHNLDYKIAHLPELMPPGMTLIDGIYTLERGPTFDGKAHRSNMLVCSNDFLAADKVGATLLGFDPSEIPHLKDASRMHERPSDLSKVKVVGEKIEDLAEHHEWEFIYYDDGTLPLSFKRDGIEGIKYRKYDKTMCTYCSFMNGILLMAIKQAWKGEPFDEIEVLTGKKMEPTPGMNKTILLGQCQYLKNKDNPVIHEMIPIKGCPPSEEGVKKALEEAGIKVPSYVFKNIDKGPLLFLQKYKGKSEFTEDFYTIDE
ncbi:MAG: DUF362 domain-containing protein [Promethearchaeia archaeon]